MVDLIIETHKYLERQGPGSAKMPLKALSFPDNLYSILKVAGLSCGTGSQTVILAQSIPNIEVVGLD